MLAMMSETLAGYGALGVFSAYLIWQCYQKDKLLEKRDEQMSGFIVQSVHREGEIVKALTELTVIVRSFGGHK